MSPAFKTAHIRKATRHLLLCCEITNSKCCSAETSQLSWDFLKTRLRELQLVGKGRHVLGEAMNESFSKTSDVVKVIRSKVGCLQVCSNGPIAVVYPEVSLVHAYVHTDIYIGFLLN